MKTLQLFITLILFTISSLGFGQCEAPTVLDWTTLNDSTFVVVFESSVAGDYEIETYTEHDSGEGGYSDLTGPAIVGINTITVSLSDLSFGSWSELKFYSSWLSITCEPGQESERTKFYMSSKSLRNNEGFTCSNLLTPLANLFEQLNIFEIPLTIDTDETIESVSFFIDYGGQFNFNDLILELVHPNGSSVVLFDNSTPSASMSVLFSDNALQTFEYDYYGYIGNYLPVEPLSEFNGLPSQGEWKLRVQQFFLPDFDFIYSICLNVNESPCESSLEGNVFFDLNGNGIQNTEDALSPLTQIQNSADNYIFYSTSNGQYWQCSPAGDANLSVLNVPQYYAANPLSYSLSEGEHLTGQNIAFTSAVAVSDLEVDLFSLDPNRPGFEGTYQVSVNNVGTICRDDVSFTLTFPEYVEIISSENNDLVFNGNSASLEIGEMCPYFPSEFSVEILLDDTVSLGTVLEANATVTPIAGDADEHNNTFTSSVIVVGSYDPNDKQVSATSIGDDFLEDGAPLKYTVRFQNTGTFYAERVVIADTIDTDLDLNSLHIISTSHDMQLVREGNVLYFEFDQIFLPDSATDLEGSNGFVRYEIHPLPSFSEGDLIENTAYIYFDFNEPIITNTVVTGFQNPLSVSNEVEFETRLFPNPASQSITLTWAQDVEVDRIEIYDLSGRLIQSQSVSTGKSYTIELDDLTDGMYLINVVSGALQSRQKFMKIAER